MQSRSAGAGGMVGTEDPWFRVDVREFETRSHPAQASVSSLLTRGRYREVESSRPVCGFESLSRVSFPLVDSVRPRFSAYPYDRAKGRRGACFLHCVVMSLVGGAMTTWYSGGTPARVNHRRTVVGGLPFLTCSAQRADPATLNSGSKSYKFVPSMARVP